jgi:hypothetical protein
MLSERLTNEYSFYLPVSRWDRLLLFGGLNLAAAAMFIIGFVLVPTGVFLIKPRKFVVL